MKTIIGLELNRTFEKLTETGQTWEFPADLQIYSSAATNFRNSWYGSQLDPVGSVVGESHDANVEKIEAVMKQIIDQQERMHAEKKEHHRRMFAASMPTGNNEAEHVYQSTGSQAGPAMTRSE